MNLNPKAHILVVDDDERLRSLLQRYLKEQDYAVSVAQDALQAKKLLSLLTPDMMVLDVMMPGQTGLEFARELELEKESESVTPPILMLTAMDTPDDRIAGLESGVEDYLTKPFEPRELLLRLSNILKRTQKPAIEEVTHLKFGPYLFDKHSQQLTHPIEGPVTLTTAERDILQRLTEKPNEPVSREILSDNASSTRQVDVQIGRLRKKLGDATLIQTVRGKGYKLVVIA